MNGPGSYKTVEIKEVPETIIKLREELQQPWNQELTKLAMEGGTFEECLGIIAYHLRIQLDGTYHIPQLCGKLLEELKKRRLTFH